MIFLATLCFLPKHSSKMRLEDITHTSNGCNSSDSKGVVFMQNRLESNPEGTQPLEVKLVTVSKPFKKYLPHTLPALESMLRSCFYSLRLKRTELWVLWKIMKPGINYLPESIHVSMLIRPICRNKPARVLHFIFFYASSWALWMLWWDLTYILAVWESILPPNCLLLS